MVMGRSYTQFPDGTGTPQAWREVRAVHNFPRDAPAPIESQPKRSGNGGGGGANTNIVGAASRVQVVREGRRGQDVGIAIPVWPKPGGRVSAIRPDPRGNAQSQRQHGAAAAERPPLSPLASCCARIWHYDDGHRWYSFRGKGVGWLCVLLPALLVAGPVVQALKLMQLNGRCERCWARCWARDPLYDWFSWRDKGPGWRAMLAPLYALLCPLVVVFVIFTVLSLAFCDSGTAGADVEAGGGVGGDGGGGLGGSTMPNGRPDASKPHGKQAAAREPAW
ncbi:uncharacterized protein LOC144718757 [Lampetra planeri]